MRKAILLVGCYFALASCGGGGSSGGAIAVIPGGSTPTPTPTPTPSSSPTPTPTPTLNTGEIKPSAGATFIAATMDLTTTGGATNNLNGQTTGGTTSNRSTALNTVGFSGSYNATTGYRLMDAANAANFGPSELTSDTTATDTVNPTVLFTRVASPTEDYLALYKVAVNTSSTLGSGTVTPRYGGIAGWQHTAVSAGSRRTRLDYFAFGSATPAGAMPQSGVVKFSVVGFGNYAGDTDLYFTNHLDTLTVDFGARTISGSVTTSGRNFFTGGFGGLYAVTVAGAISGNTVTGPTGSNVAVASGHFRLLFVGPNADEFIFTFVGQDGRGTYVGSSVGVRNPYLP